MSTVITAPKSGDKVALNEKIEFNGTATDGVTEVIIVADGKFVVGSSTVHDGKWSIAKVLTTPGNRQFMVSGLDAGGRMVDINNVALTVTMDVSDERQNLVKFAMSNVGKIYETGINSGATLDPIFSYTGIPNTEWCLMFCSFAYHSTTQKDPDWGKATAYVPNLVTWAKKHGRWIREDDPHDTNIPKGSPKPGDLFVMGDSIKLASKENYPHVGMVRGITSDRILSVEGNHNDAVGTDSHSRVHTEPNAISPRYIAGYVRTFAD